MREYDFEIYLNLDADDVPGFLDGYEDVIFEWFHGTVHPTLRSGHAILSCTSEADSLVEAVRNVLVRIEQEGLEAERVELSPECFREAA